MYKNTSGEILGYIHYGCPLLRALPITIISRIGLENKH
jgi:hypothetical protein